VKTSRLETGVIQLDKKTGRLFDTVAQAMGGIVYAAEKKEILPNRLLCWPTGNLDSHTGQR